GGDSLPRRSHGKMDASVRWHDGREAGDGTESADVVIPANAGIHWNACPQYGKGAPAQRNVSSIYDMRIPEPACMRKRAAIKLPSSPGKERHNAKGTDSLRLSALQPAARHLVHRRDFRPSDLPARIWQHQNDAADGFSDRYQLHILAWWEAHATMDSAILREKALKAWKRLWKIELVESLNPQWRDLSADIL